MGSNRKNKHAEDLVTILHLIDQRQTCLCKTSLVVRLMALVPVDFGWASTQNSNGSR